MISAFFGRSRLELGVLGWTFGRAYGPANGWLRGWASVSSRRSLGRNIFGWFCATRGSDIRRRPCGASKRDDYYVVVDGGGGRACVRACFPAGRRSAWRYVLLHDPSLVPGSKTWHVGWQERASELPPARQSDPERRG